MIWALVENQKEKAQPKSKGICPFCTGKVISKCGSIKIWHWAHQREENCDSWHEPETNWHLHWKLSFGIENTEQIIIKGGKRHIADILTTNKIVIELQNSPIKKETIREREEFYGDRMLWLINGAKFKENLVSKKYWKDPRYDEYQNDAKKLVKLMQEAKIPKRKNEIFFKWKNPRKSWNDTQRPVFIDFGGKNILMVKEGMGTTQIRGTYILKKKFLEKYKGDFNFYLNRIKTSK